MSFDFGIKWVGKPEKGSVHAAEKGSGTGGGTTPLAKRLDKRSVAQEKAEPSHDIAFTPEEAKASERFGAWIKANPAVMARYGIKDKLEVQNQRGEKIIVDQQVSLLQKARILADFLSSDDAPVPSQGSEEYRDMMTLLSNDMVLPKILTVVGSRLMREYKQGPSFEKFDDVRANILEQRKGDDTGSFFTLDDFRSTIAKLTVKAHLEEDQKHAIDNEKKIREAEENLAKQDMPSEQKDAWKRQKEAAQLELRERRQRQLEKDLENPALQEAQRAKLIKELDETRQGRRDSVMSISQELVRDMVLKAMNAPDDADRSLRYIYENFRTEKGADLLKSVMSKLVGDVKAKLKASDGMEEYQRKYVAEYLLPLILDEETLSASKRTETQQKRDRITRMRNIAWILQSHGILALDVDEDGMPVKAGMDPDGMVRLKAEAVMFFGNKPEKGRDLGSKDLPAFIQNLGLSPDTRLVNLFSSLRAPRRLHRSHNLPRSVVDVENRIKEEDIKRGRTPAEEAKIDVSKLADPLDILWTGKKMSKYQQKEIRRNIGTFRKNDEPRLANLEKSFPDVDALLQRVDAFIAEQEAFLTQKKAAGVELTEQEVSAIRVNAAAIRTEIREHINAMRRYRNEVDKRIETFGKRIKEAGGPRAAKSKEYRAALEGMLKEYQKLGSRHTAIDAYIKRDKSGVGPKNLDVAAIRMQRLVDMLPKDTRPKQERPQAPRRERVGRRRFTSERNAIMSTALAVDLKSASDLDIASGMDKAERRARINLYTDMRYQVLDYLVRAGYPKLEEDPSKNAMRDELIKFFKDEIGAEILKAPAELFQDDMGKDQAERAQIQVARAELRAKLQEEVNKVVEFLRENRPQTA